MEHIDKMKECIRFIPGNIDHHDIVDNDQMGLLQAFIVGHGGFRDVSCSEHGHNFIHSSKIGPIAIFESMMA